MAESVGRAQGVQHVFSRDLRFNVFAIDTACNFCVIVSMEIKSVSVSPGADVAKVHGCVVRKRGISDVVGGVILLFLIRIQGVGVDAACSLCVCRQIVKRRGCVWPFVAVHQLIGRDLSDKLLLLGDKVHLWSLLASTHERTGSIVVKRKSVMREASLVVHALVERIEAGLVEVCLVPKWLLFVFLTILARLGVRTLASHCTSGVAASLMRSEGSVLTTVDIGRVDRRYLDACIRIFFLFRFSVV